MKQINPNVEQLFVIGLIVIAIVVISVHIAINLS